MKNILIIALKNTLLLFIFVLLFDAITYAFCFTFTGIVRRDVFNYLQGLDIIVNVNIVFLVVLSTLTPLIVNVTKQVNGYLFSVTQQNIGNNLKNYLYQVFFQIPINKRIKDSSGDIVIRFREDINDIVNFFTEVYDQTPKLLLSIISLVVMFKVNTTLSIISVLPLLIVIFTVHIVQDRLVKNRSIARQKTDKTTQFLSDLFNSLESVKVSDKKDYYLNRYKKLCVSRGKYSLKDSFFQKLLSLFSINLMYFALAVILFFAYHEIQGGTFSIGDFVLFEYYFWFLTDLPGVFSSVYTKFKQMEVVKQRMQEFTDLAETPLGKDSCKYDFTAVIVKNKYQMKKNQLTLITGMNGSGKSRLLKNIFVNQSDDIYFQTKNGCSNEITVQAPQICYLPQIPHLISDTIKNNICMGLDYDAEKADRILQVVDLTYEFQQGHLTWETYVGNSGEQLSGGQIKRLALARILYRDPKIILLDDLTSGLDLVTEQKVLENLKELKQAIIVMTTNNVQITSKADYVISI